MHKCPSSDAEQSQDLAGVFQFGAGYRRGRPAGSASGIGQRDESGLIGQSLWALLAGGGGATWASRPDCGGRNSGLQALDLPAPNTRASIANFAHRQQPVAEEVCSSGSRCMM